MPTNYLRYILCGAVLVGFCLDFISARAQIDDHAAVYDMEGQPVLTESDGTCVRTKWPANHDVCHTEQAAPLPRVVISQADRTVYFLFNVATLTPGAMTKLDTLANDIKSRNDVKGARVVGFADRIGTHSYNETLSQKRAEAVKDYLVSRGIINASVADTRWFGATMPTTNCPSDLQRVKLIACLQQDRRVEVEIDYVPEAVAGR